MYTIDKVRSYVESNSFQLFKDFENTSSFVIFDLKGFWMSEKAEIEFNKIKNLPHIYIVHTDDNSGYYIGISNQKGGRWKRSNAYHLRDLACDILGLKPNQGNQNHVHWIENWFEKDSLKKINNTNYIIKLKKKVNISFIPFYYYSNLNFDSLSKPEIKKINSIKEEELITHFKNQSISLLNVHHNKK